MIKWIPAIILSGSGFVCTATNFRGGEITLKLESGLTYIVTLKAYSNTGADIRFGGGDLDFGDGSDPYVVPMDRPTLRPDLGAQVGYIEYPVTHTFPGPGMYTVTYSDRGLASSIINVTSSIETGYVLETMVFIQAGVDNSSPDFLAPPLFRHPAGREYCFSTQASDGNNYRLSYVLADPVPGGTNYTQPEQLSLNYVNGALTWDTKFHNDLTIGTYCFAVRVYQYDNQGRFISYVTRIIQAILEDSNTSLETTDNVEDVNNQVLVPLDNQKTVKVLLFDNNSDGQFNWDVFADPLIADSLNFSQYDSVSGSKKIRVGLLSFSSTNATIRENPYSVTLRGTSGKFSKDICFLLSTKEHFVISGIGEHAPSMMRAYPNPFSGSLRIETGTEDERHDAIFLDARGVALLQAPFKSGEPIDTSNLPGGLYILQVTKGDTVARMKMVKK